MSNNKASSFELVVHIPEVDCRRRIKLDPNMTAGELIDFIVSRVEVKKKKERKKESSNQNNHATNPTT